MNQDCEEGKKGEIVEIALAITPSFSQLGFYSGHLLVLTLASSGPSS